MALHVIHVIQVIRVMQGTPQRYPALHSTPWPSTLSTKCLLSMALHGTPHHSKAMHVIHVLHILRGCPRHSTPLRFTRQHSRSIRVIRAIQVIRHSLRQSVCSTVLRDTPRYSVVLCSALHDRAPFSSIDRNLLVYVAIRSIRTIRCCTWLFVVLHELRSLMCTPRIPLHSTALHRTPPHFVCYVALWRGPHTPRNPRILRNPWHSR